MEAGCSGYMVEGPVVKASSFHSCCRDGAQPCESNNNHKDSITQRGHKGAKHCSRAIKEKRTGQLCYYVDLISLIIRYYLEQVALLPFGLELNQLQFVFVESCQRF